MHRRSPLVAAIAAVAAVGVASTALAAAPNPTPTPAGPAIVDSAHSAVIAQGLGFVGTGSHVWTLDSYALGTPVDVPSPGPTFVLGATGGTRIIETDTNTFQAHLVAGEAVMIPGGSSLQLRGSDPSATALVIGLRGGTGDRQFELLAGDYDIELVRDVLAPGERLTIQGAVASLVLVGSGTATLADGQLLQAGYNLAMAGDVALANHGTVDAEVFVLTATPLAVEAAAALAVGGEEVAAGGDDGAVDAAPEPDLSAGQQPAPTTPGATTPAGPPPSTPSTTGPTTPPNPPNAPTTTAAPDASSTVPPTTAPPATAPPTAPPTTAPPTTAAPTTTAEPGEQSLAVAMTSCSGSSSLSVRATASAGPTTAYRRNVQSVVVSTKNEYGNWISNTSMSWIGEHTANRNEWSATNVPPPHVNHRDGGIRITARSAGGQEATIYVSCS